VSQTFECRDSDQPPELSRPIFARSPRRAAALYRSARDRETVEYPVESEVIVTDERGVETTWVVTLESRPEYRAELRRNTQGEAT
jgi:hypothetical protein